jgi:hypothetical protein
LDKAVHLNIILPELLPENQYYKKDGNYMIADEAIPQILEYMSKYEEAIASEGQI